VSAWLAAVEGLNFQRVRESVQIEKLRARPVGEDWLLEAEVVRRRRAAG
jgi:hypothetical protein